VRRALVRQHVHGIRTILSDDAHYPAIVSAYLCLRNERHEKMAHAIGVIEGKSTVTVCSDVG
jgi:hypothetical protein